MLASSATSIADSGESGGATVDTVLEDERRLTGMGYKQELKYVVHRPLAPRDDPLTGYGVGQARVDPATGKWTMRNSLGSITIRTLR